MGKPANLRIGSYGGKRSSSDSTSSDEEQAEPSSQRRQLLREREKTLRAEALRKKMTSRKVKSGLGAAIDAEDPELSRSRERESDQDSESEPDTSGNVGGTGISDKQKEDEVTGNQPVEYTKTPSLLAGLDP